MRSAKKLIRLILGLLIATLFVWLVLRQVSVAQLSEAFAGVRWGWVLAALICFLLGYAARIERWRQMLVCDNATLRWLDCSGPFMGSFALNNLLPMRAGDILRSFAFNNQLGVSSGVVVATLFVERLLDLLMIVILLGIALLLAGANTSVVGDLGVWTLALLSAAIVLALVFPGVFAPLVRWFGRLAARFLPNIGARIEREANKALGVLGHLSGRGTMAKLLAWSALAWAAEGMVFLLCAQALTSLGVRAAAWLALPVGTLSTLLPGTPGYVGTFDYFVVRAMTSLGNGAGAATAYALLVHFMLWLPPTLIGGAYLMARSVRVKTSHQRGSR